MTQPTASPPGSRTEVAQRWSWRGAGRRYSERRFRSPLKERRDPTRVAALVDRHLLRREGVAVLDAPCGTGRLRPALSGIGVRWVGVDVSGEMLDEAARPGPGALVRADVFRLPFTDGAFEAVVCCRLLHHLAGGPELARLVAELVRVSSRLVVASFWDAGTLPAWRARVLPSARDRRRRRVAHSRQALRAHFAGAGAEIVAFASSFPLLSRQAYLAARKLPHGIHEEREPAP